MLSCNLFSLDNSSWQFHWLPDFNYNLNTYSRNTGLSSTSAAHTKHLLDILRQIVLKSRKQKKEFTFSCLRSKFPLLGNGITIHPVVQARNQGLLLDYFPFPPHPISHQVHLLLSPFPLSSSLGQHSHWDSCSYHYWHDLIFWIGKPFTFSKSIKGVYSEKSSSTHLPDTQFIFPEATDVTHFFIYIFPGIFYTRMCIIYSIPFFHHQSCSIP